MNDQPLNFCAFSMDTPSHDILVLTPVLQGRGQQREYAPGTRRERLGAPAAASSRP